VGCYSDSNIDDEFLSGMASGSSGSAGATAEDDCNELVEEWPGPALAAYTPLTVAEVEQVIIGAVEQALAVGADATVAVVDREGFILGVFAMPAAPIGPAPPVPATLDPAGTAGVNAAIVKARTAAWLSSDQNAFTTRTAFFIVQSHFPPGVEYTPGGPLYGVQNSSDTGSDVRSDAAGIGSNPTPLTPPFPPLDQIGPNGLTGSFGGLPLYKGGFLVGGVGVSSTIADEDERIAVAGTRGFAAPQAIQACEILVDGIRLPFHAAVPPIVMPTLAFGALPGGVVAGFPVRAGLPLPAVPTATLGGVTGELRYPIVASGVSALTAADVTTIIGQAAARSAVTRAAIRRPLGVPAQVWIAVVDTGGNILGLFRTPDAPLFSLDVSVQKARTAVVYSDGVAEPALGEPIAGLPLGSAVSTRAVGFMAQDFYPPGIQDSGMAGPLFGVQDALPLGLGAGIAGLDITPGLIGDATDGNGITIFPGGIPLYIGSVLVGAIGISGDGVDQDDYIAAGGAVGYEPAEAIRSDQFDVLGARLPWVKFPRNPTEGVNP
jgi:uncharacterized protein GlcG (DUF336 family)